VSAAGRAPVLGAVTEPYAVRRLLAALGGLAPEPPPSCLVGAATLPNGALVTCSVAGERRAWQPHQINVGRLRVVRLPGHPDQPFPEIWISRFRAGQGVSPHAGGELTRCLPR
jgi:hypothetical protein